MTILDTLTDLQMKVASALFAVALLIATLGGPKGPPSAPSAQMVFPFMVEAAEEVGVIRRG